MGWVVGYLVLKADGGTIVNSERTHKKFLLVRQEGTRSVRRNISHYNLDVIIAVGSRVKSQVATRFRQWAKNTWGRERC